MAFANLVLVMSFSGTLTENHCEGYKNFYVVSGSISFIPGNA